jgi:hypothetical protein
VGTTKYLRFKVEKNSSILKGLLSVLNFKVTATLIAANRIAMTIGQFLELCVFEYFLLASTPCSVAWAECPWAIWAWWAADLWSSELQHLHGILVFRLGLSHFISLMRNWKNSWICESISNSRFYDRDESRLRLCFGAQRHPWWKWGWRRSIPNHWKHIGMMNSHG